jgi:hypothetical protein
VSPPDRGEAKGAELTAVSFTKIAQPNPRGVLLVEIPEAVVKRLGAGKRVPVRVTLYGAKYRSTVAVYGGRYYLPARKDVRDAAKLVVGGGPESPKKSTPLRGPSR